MRFSLTNYSMGLSLLCILGMAGATDYYVGSSGNDGNNGTSSTSAWASISKISSADLNAGDRVFFEGGKTFSGSLSFGSDDVGTSSSGILITSYGTGRATINGGSATGITVTSSQYLTIRNINSTGSGRTSNSNGSGVYMSRASNCALDSSDCSGYRTAGVRLSACTNVRVTNVYAHDNGYAGIITGGNTCTGIYVGYCRTLYNDGDPDMTDNHSGSGIIFEQTTTNSTIEYCESAFNGRSEPDGHANGPVGIWTWSSSNILIQYCISHNNTSRNGDGGGFDFDGGTTNSTLQYCYTYNNKSSGMLMWEWGVSSGITGNTVRYSVFENDGQSGLRFGHSGGGAVTNNHFYNNVVYNLNNTALKYDEGNVGTITFRNNIFVTGPNVDIVSPWSGAQFAGNCYWRTDGSFRVGGQSSLSAWANATGQEKVNNVIVGLQANPQFVGPTPTTNKITDPRQLPQLLSYMLSSNSPCINKGLDITNPGTKDFYGNAIPSGGVFDIGAHEYGGGSPPDTTPIPTPEIDAFSQIEAETWTSMSGIQNEACSEGGQNAGWWDAGDWIAFANVNFGSGPTNVQVRVAAEQASQLSFRLGSETGTIIATVTTPATGGYQVYATVTATVSGATGVQALYVTRPGAASVNINWFVFTSGHTGLRSAQLPGSARSSMASPDARALFSISGQRLSGSSAGIEGTVRRIVVQGSQSGRPSLRLVWTQ